VPFANVFSIGRRPDRHRVAATIALACAAAAAGTTDSRGHRVTIPELGSSFPEVVVRVILVYLFLSSCSGSRANAKSARCRLLELIVVLYLGRGPRTRWSARTARCGAA
jgi:hypothetical protein